MSQDGRDALPSLPDADMYNFAIGDDSATSPHLEAATRPDQAFADLPLSLSVTEPGAVTRQDLNTTGESISALLYTSHSLNAPFEINGRKVYQRFCVNAVYLAMLDSSLPTARIERTRLEVAALPFEPRPNWMIGVSKPATLWLHRLNAFYQATMTPAIPLSTQDPPTLDVAPIGSLGSALDCRQVFACANAQLSVSRAAITTNSSSSSSSGAAARQSPGPSMELVASAAAQTLAEPMSLKELFTTVMLPGTLHAYVAKLRSSDREFKGSELCSD